LFQFVKRGEQNMTDRRALELRAEERWSRMQGRKLLRRADELKEILQVIYGEGNNG
jgi:hypothetical protein